MKTETYKNRTIYIEQNEEKEYCLVNNIAAVFRLAEDNPFLFPLGIDPKNFVEEDIGMIEVENPASIKEIRADGVTCKGAASVFTFSLVGKEEVHIEIIRGKTFRYELAFKEPSVDFPKGRAMAGEEVEFIVYGKHDKSLFSAFRCVDPATGEETIIPVSAAEFPPNAYLFTMPEHDAMLYLLEK